MGFQQGFRPRLWKSATSNPPGSIHRKTKLSKSNIAKIRAAWTDLREYEPVKLAIIYRWIVVSAFAGFCVTCCVLGNCERSHPAA